MHKPKLHSWVTPDEEHNKLSVHVAAPWHGVKVVAEVLDDCVEFKIYETYGRLNEDNEDLEGACIKQVKLIKAQWK